VVKMFSREKPIKLHLLKVNPDAAASAVEHEIVAMWESLQGRKVTPAEVQELRTNIAARAPKKQ